MRKYNKLWIVLLSCVALCTSCIDSTMNVDPTTADEDHMKPEWLLNSSLTGAQLDPDISQRISSLTWMSAARQDRDFGEGFACGEEADDFIADYFQTTRACGWLRDANLAVKIAKERIDKGLDVGLPYYRNVYQMARIWRDYLLTQIADGAGPIPLKGFDGENPDFNSVKEIYEFVLKDLAKATAGLDPKIEMGKSYDITSDLFYGRDKTTEIDNWIRYGNSLRMRFAMRLADTKGEESFARQNFEEAANTGKYINDLKSIAEAPEAPGYQELKSILGLEYDVFTITKTFSNLIIGLGGQKYIFPSDENPADQLDKHLIDPYHNLGVKIDRNVSMNTNDPTAGYFFNGIPKFCDPRTSILFDLPYVFDSRYPGGSKTSEFTQFSIKDSRPQMVPIIYTNSTTNKKDTIKLDIKATFGSFADGKYADATVANNSLLKGSFVYASPALSHYFRQNKLAYVFYGPWESYFLMAEAKLRGWNVNTTGDDKYDYEQGIRESFDYFNNDPFFSKVCPIKIPHDVIEAYIGDTNYNRVGTCVNYDITTEAQPTSMNYTCLYGDEAAAGTVNYKYPKNSIYKGGQYNNDKLTKILTQKYIAEMPWGGLEAWNDQRRLGLPFFETSCADLDMPQEAVNIKAGNKECRWDCYPQRFRYPANLQGQDPRGYQQGVSLLNGPDHIRTPLYWSGEANQK